MTALAPPPPSPAGACTRDKRRRRTLNRTDTLRPALADFVRHARRFGPECVVETARDYLIGGDLVELEADLVLLDVGHAGKRRRRTTPTLRAQVAALRRRGMVPSAIADTLNISDRRVAD
jgi:hypothetical protein